MKTLPCKFFCNRSPHFAKEEVASAAEQGLSFKKKVDMSILSVARCNPRSPGILVIPGDFIRFQA